MIEVTKDGRYIASGDDMRALRLQVARRASFHCDNCTFKRVRFDEGHLHHVTLRGMGGANRNDVAENLMWLCEECHRIEHNSAMSWEPAV